MLGPIREVRDGAASAVWGAVAGSPAMLVMHVVGQAESASVTDLF